MNSEKKKLTFNEKIELTKESMKHILPTMNNLNRKMESAYKDDPSAFIQPSFRYYVANGQTKEDIYSKKNAFITSMFISGDYIPSALILGYSLKKNHTKYPIICMVQDKPYIEDGKVLFEGVKREGIDDLLEIFDMVVGVDLLKIQDYKPNPKYKHFTNAKGYQNILYYATKGQILALTEFDRLFYLDASNYVGHNIDFIFDEYKGSTFQYNIEFKLTKLGYRGAHFLVHPNIVSYYKLLLLIKHYHRFFKDFYYVRGVDELVIYFAVYPQWANLKIRSNFSCAKNKKNCDIRYFQMYKPFRPLPETHQHIKSQVFEEWDQIAKEMIQKHPHLRKYYEKISTFRETKIFS